MVHLQSMITKLLVKWNQESYILLRIEIIMAVVFTLYLMMFLMSLMRHSMHSSVINKLKLLDAVSDSILVYILGVMQAAPFKSEMFPVWSIALVSFRINANCLSRYGTYTELRNVFKLLAAAYVNISHGSKLLSTPFWIYWCFLVLKCFTRIWASNLSSESLWHGRSSELIQKYMGVDYVQSNVAPDGCYLEAMNIYKHLVYGESKKKNLSGSSPGNRDSRSLITLDKVLRNDDSQLKFLSQEMRELCLAFALSRLLRCRLEGATLDVELVFRTRKLICSQILEGAVGFRGAFKIPARELAFLGDYFYTSYPMIFCKGLCSFSFIFLQFISRFSIVFWIAVSVHHTDYIQALNATILILVTYDCLFFSIIVETLEMISYVLSDWMKLICVCKYLASSSKNAQRLGGVILGTKFWYTGGDRLLDQYVFLESFNYTTWMRKLMNRVTMGIVKSKSEGRYCRDPLKIPEKVKVSVFDALCSLCSEITDVHNRPRNLRTLHGAEQMEPYWSACLKLPTCSHVILVWHIATSLCEMKLAQVRGIDLKNPASLGTSVLHLMKHFGYSSHHYLLNENTLDGDLRTNYEVANSLSRYCAYLLVFKPDLLPDTILVPKVLFKRTVRHAREILKDRDSMQSIYEKLITVAQEEPSVEGSKDQNMGVNILQEGARLGNKLIAENNCWEILAKVWVNLLVHIAPSSNAQAHGKYLESKGELLTIIWALFCHCGIEKSEVLSRIGASATATHLDPPLDLKSPLI